MAPFYEPGSDKLGEMSNVSHTSLGPPPIVVDADVLLRNIDFGIRNSWTPRLMQAAVHGQLVTRGVALYATDVVLGEVERHLPDVARRRGVSTEFVVQQWNKVFLPRLRFVELREGELDDARIDAVRALHETDGPTAALSLALAPSILLTDNRKHFAPLGLPDKPVDRIAGDIFALSRALQVTETAALLPTLSGRVLIEGSKKAISRLGARGSAVVASIALGGLIYWWRSASGERFRDAAAGFGSEAGALITQAIVDSVDLGEDLWALAIEPPDNRPSAFQSVAAALALETAPVSTAEIAQRLRVAGYDFSHAGNHRTQVRAWLVANDSFFEIRRGHWILGWEAAPYDPSDFD